jgi:hypothetical protein
MRGEPFDHDLLITKGVNFGNAGRAVEGRALLEAGIRIADEDGLVLTALRGRINLSANPAIEPRLGAAVSRAALETARRIGNRNVEASLVGNFAFSALALGEWDAVVAEIQALPADVASNPVFLGNTAQLLAMRGEPFDHDLLIESVKGLDPVLAEGVVLDTEATEALVEGRSGDAIRLATRLADVSAQSAPYATVLAGHAAAWSHSAAEVERALGRLEATRVRGPELDAARIGLRASLDALEGRPAEALSGFRQATERLRELGLRYPQMLAAIDVAATLGASDPETAALIDEGRALMSSLGAVALIARLDEALEGHPSAPGGVLARPETGGSSRAETRPAGRTRPAKDPTAG